MPRLSIAVAFIVLAILASTLSYTGFLVVGVLADYLGTSRFLAGLLLGILFARFPWISKGKARIVGLLPKPLRRPSVVVLLAVCLLRFSVQGDSVPALLMGFAMAFVLGFPLLRKLLLARMSASVMHFASGGNAQVAADSNVIEGEFRERKE